VVPSAKGDKVEMVFYNEQTLLNCDKIENIPMEEY
jgi:hypothetical protein